MEPNRPAHFHSELLPQQTWISVARQIGQQDPSRVALVDEEGGEVTYAELLQRAEGLARQLRLKAGRAGVDAIRPRVAFVVEASPAWVVVQWAIWLAEAIAVPISPKHPAAEIEYILSHAAPRLVVASPEHHDRVSLLGQAAKIPVVDVDGDGRGMDESLLPGPSESVDAADDAAVVAGDALMLYTSGTTKRPKGVVLTHQNLHAQMSALTTSWNVTAAVHALLTLPLHHVHGIVNVVACTLFAGGRVTMLKAFDATDVTERLLDEESTLNVFMAVPAIYRRLLDVVETDDGAADGTGLRNRYREAGARMRLMVSGSAALPSPLFAAWERLTGHRLLERYGMTEIGMALSNPLDGDRVPSTVGMPLPSVAVRLRDGGEILEGDGDGEIEVAGPSVFRIYFNDDTQTRSARTEDGWFRTGDRARRQAGRYSILGRMSVDILKTGGEKVSALEIEAVLLEHPAVAAVAVVGLPSEQWGDEVVAVIEAANAFNFDASAVRAFAKERLAPFKVPRRIVEAALPRNALGKVQKQLLIKMLLPLSD